MNLLGAFRMLTAWERGLARARSFLAGFVKSFCRVD